MVLKDASKLLHGQIWQCRADGLEGSVVGYKHGEVLCGVNSVGEVRLHESASGITESSINGRSGNVGGDGKDSVDHVDDTSGEVHVLKYGQSCSGVGNGSRHLQPE